MTGTRTRTPFRATDFRTTMACATDISFVVRTVPWPYRSDDDVGRARPVSTPSSFVTKLGSALSPRTRREFAEFERIPAAVSRPPAPIEKSVVSASFTIIPLSSGVAARS